MLAALKRNSTDADIEGLLRLIAQSLPNFIKIDKGARVFGLAWARACVVRCSVACVRLVSLTVSLLLERSGGLLD